MTENYWDKLSGDDEHAASYMLTYGEGPGSELRFLIGTLINKGEEVLDVGCGPGWNLDHFCQYGPQLKSYVGMDYSQRFVRVAQARIADQYLSQFPYHPQMVRFMMGDVRHIEWPDKSFDVVIMQDVLEHTNGYEKPVSEALRVARKRIIFTFWHLMDKDEDNPVNDDGDDGWGAWYSKPKWEKYLDGLDLHWLHDRIPRKDAWHDLYIVDLEETHGKES